MIALGWTRKTVNQHLQARAAAVRGAYIRTASAAGSAHSPPHGHRTPQRPLCRPGRRGRQAGPCRGRECGARRMSPTAGVGGMIRLQLLTGAWPDPARSRKSGRATWSVTPTCGPSRRQSHKSEHHEQARVIFIGPRAQIFFGTGFSTIGRRPPIAGAGRASTCVTIAMPSTTAAGRAKVATWSPNQLRHTRATELRKQFGIDTASTLSSATRICRRRRFTPSATRRGRGR